MSGSPRTDAIKPVSPTFLRRRSERKAESESQSAFPFSTPQVVAPNQNGLGIWKLHCLAAHTRPSSLQTLRPWWGALTHLVLVEPYQIIGSLPCCGLPVLFVVDCCCPDELRVCQSFFHCWGKIEMCLLVWQKNRQGFRQFGVFSKFLYSVNHLYRYPSLSLSPPMP